MQFPIQSEIEPVQYGTKSATLLKIDGNAGQIPTTFQYSIWGEEALLAQGVDAMTDDQWAAWVNQNDETYILQCVAENLGLTIVKPAPASSRPSTSRSSRAAKSKKKR